MKTAATSALTAASSSKSAVPFITLACPLCGGAIWPMWRRLFIEKRHQRGGEARNSVFFGDERRLQPKLAQCRGSDRPDGCEWRAMQYRVWVIPCRFQPLPQPTHSGGTGERNRVNVILDENPLDEIGGDRLRHRAIGGDHLQPFKNPLRDVLDGCQVYRDAFAFQRARGRRANRSNPCETPVGPGVACHRQSAGEGAYPIDAGKD